MKQVSPVAELLWQCTNLVNAERLRRVFRPKIAFEFERGNFVVKTIQSVAELDQVMRLRYEVFHREFLNRRFPFGFDSDAYDKEADHLVIQDTKLGKIVGTYRLIASTYSNAFYSATEFTIRDFLTQPGEKLEMSRACIHRDYRRGVVMTLLWRGLVEYIERINARYLFGCASIKTMDPHQVALVKRYLTSKDLVTERYNVQPLPSYRMPPEEMTNIADLAAGRELVPPLLASYFKAGARVALEPALDKAFRCVDFFTVLDLKELTRSFERKYTA